MEQAEQYMNNLSYEDFKKSCEKVISMTDTQLKQNFGANSDPRLIRMKYQHMISNITQEAYEKMKTANKANMHKTKGNQFFSQGKYQEAINEYSEGLNHIEEIQDEDIKKNSEITMRDNIAMAYINLKEFDETLKHCEIVLQKEPLDIRAIYRISLALIEKGNKEKAASYLKRIILRKSTDDKLVTLYKNTVLPMNEPEFINKIIKLINAGNYKEINNEFLKEGFVLTNENIENLMKIKPDMENIRKKIIEFDQKRRYEFFMKYPIIEDLLEDNLLFEEIEKVTNDANSDFTKRMLGQYKALTHDQLKEAMKGIRMRMTVEKYLNYLPSKKTGTIFMGAIIVLVLGYLLIFTKVLK